MSDFFERNFPSVRAMLENERDQANAQGATDSANGKPWKVMGLNLGVATVDTSHATEGEAKAALAEIHRTCASWVRDYSWVEERP